MSEQVTLNAFEEPNLDALTDAEREVYRRVRLGEHGVREYARQTGRVPGTVGNLLARADAKLESGR